MERETSLGSPAFFVGERMGSQGGKARGASGKFVKQKSAAAEGQDTVEKEPLTPSQCRSHMRRTLAKEFEDIVNGFVKAAKKGSCPHLKLATELLKPEPRISHKKGPVARLLEELGEE
jgi:hypothetical protein